MTLDLPVVFTVLMGAAMLAYVVLDGYDLGVGMLMPAATEQEQDVMVSSIGPFWDANETWLVLGIGLLLVAFPVAYGIILGALYLPVVVMLVGLMLRGVAFELRVKAEGWHRDFWNRLFSLGSFIAAFAQGLMLGRYVTGFADGFGYYLFAIIVGFSACGGYILMGATWLIFRTADDLQRKAIGWTHLGLLGVAVGIALISLMTPFESITIRERWFKFPDTLGVMLLPLAMTAIWFWTWHTSGHIRDRRTHHDWLPFAGAVAIYMLAFAGLVYSLFPYIVIDRLTIWEAAAHPSSLRVVLIGTAIVLPLIIVYAGYSYWVFRGKAPPSLYK